MTITAKRKILSIPAAHPYPAQVWDSGVTLQPDRTDPWWLDDPLDLERVSAIAAQIDLIHLHFGYEHKTVAEIDAWCRQLRRHRLPLVLTIHDLDHPHLSDSSTHRAQLERLVPEAAALTTLTNGAAATIERCLGRRPIVVEHPPIVLEPPNVPRRPRTIGVDLRAPRPGHLPSEPVVVALGLAATALGATVEVSVSPNAERQLARAVAAAGASPAVALRVDRSRLDDEAFARLQASYEVVVLPYRHATHSGRVEVCRDVGTKVLATDCGYLAEQWPLVTTVQQDDLALPGRASLIERLGELFDKPQPLPMAPRAQRARLRHIQAAHRQLFSSVTVAGVA